MDTKKLIKEIRKCKVDKFYFITKYCKSFNIDTQKLELIPKWKYLKDIIDAWDSGKNVIVVKSRQILATTLRCAYELHNLIFGSTNTVNKVISRTENECSIYTNPTSIFGRIKIMYENLPDFLRLIELDFSQRPGLIKNKLKNITLIGSTTTTETGRAQTVVQTFIDEAAYIPNLNFLLGSIIPMTKVFHAISTPNFKNDFYLLFERAKREKDKFITFTLNWDVRDDRPKNFLEEERKRLPEALISREYLCSFEDTSTLPKIFNLSEYKTEFNLNLKDILSIKNIPIVGGMDFGYTDPTAIVLGFIRRSKLNIFYVFEAKELLPNIFYEKIKKDIKEKFNLVDNEVQDLLKRCIIYCDPSALNIQGSAGTSYFEEYKKLELNLVPATRAENKVKILDIQKNIKHIIEYMNNSDVSLFAHLNNAHYPIDKYNNVKSIDCYEHSSDFFSSHILDAFAYLLRMRGKELEDEKLEQKRDFVYLYELFKDEDKIENDLIILS